MASAHPWIRVRLWLMFFLEFLVWGAWYPATSGYLNGTLRFSGGEIGWIYSTTALGAIISPLFVGYVADRLFSTERVLCVLHLIGGICLLASAWQESFPPLMTLLMINALCYMPTLALVNSLAFRNIDDPNRFSRLAVGGTIGWIISGLVVEFLLGGAARPNFFYLAGGGALVMAAYCLTLPHTPPKGAGGDVLGLGAVKLLREPAFLIFALCAFLISIPLSFYFAWGNAFLLERESPWPTALLTLGQFSEIAVMLIMPWFIGWIGLKNVLVLGMAAWAVRYLLFATLSFPLIILGLLFHGFCYCFVFVAGFIYVGRKAPPEISASAQSLVAFLMWGVGMFVGAKLSGYTAEQYPPPVKLFAYKENAQLESQTLPDWTWTEESKLSGKSEKFTLPQKFGSSSRDTLVLDELAEKLPEKIALGGLSYERDAFLNAIRRADSDKNGQVTHAEWMAARNHNWPAIWLWPGGLAAIVCLLFLVGGREAEEKAAPA